MNRVPPARVDILSSVSGLAFDEAWSRRTHLTLEGLPVAVLSRDDFIANTRRRGPPHLSPENNY